MKRNGRRQWRVFPWAAPRQLLPGDELRGRLLPSLSVVLPVHNQSEFLAESVRSVLTGHRLPLELIVVDDGSSEPLEPVLSPFLSDPRLSYVRQPNGGLAAALNRGFGMARGSLLTWTSADNRYHSGALDSLGGFLLANPQVDLVYGNVRLIDEEGQPFPESGYRRTDQRHPGRVTESPGSGNGAIYESEQPSGYGSEVLDLPYSADTLSLYNDNFINACFLFRRKVLERCGLHLSELRGYEDYEFWLRASIGGRLAHVDTEEPLYDYRLHRRSLTAELAASDMRTKQSAVVTECTRRKGRVSRESIFLNIGPGSEPHAANGAALDVDAGDELMSARSPHSGSSRSRSIPLALNWVERAAAARAAESGAVLPGTAGRSSRDLDGRTLLVEEVTPSSQPAEPLSHLLRSALPALGGHPALIRAVGTHRFAAAPDDPPDDDESRELLLLPPVDPPAILRRARDSHFSAVTPHAPDASVVLVPVPAWRGARCDSAAAAAEEELVRSIMFRVVQYVSRCPETTFVLLASDSEERRTADAIHLSLVGSKNLRILDVSNTDGPSSPNPPAGRGEEFRIADEPLLFAFGSVDALLLVGPGSPSLCALLELRAAASYAALAGLPLIWGEERRVVSELAGFDLFLNGLLIGGARARQSRSPYAQLLARVGAHLLPMPHLWLYPLPPTESARDEPRGARTLNEIAAGVPDYSSLEQYLVTVSPDAVAQELASFALSGRLDRSMTARPASRFSAGVSPNGTGSDGVHHAASAARGAPQPLHPASSRSGGTDHGRFGEAAISAAPSEVSQAARGRGGAEPLLMDRIERAGNDGAVTDHSDRNRAAEPQHPGPLSGSRKLSLLISNLLLRRVNE